jgi:hypothetical protein
MAKQRRMLLGACLAASLVTSQSLQGARPDREPPHIRFHNDRISEVFRYALKKSPAFEDLVTTLESQDRVVYIEEGRCPHQDVSSCLQLMLTTSGRNIQIRVDPRQAINLVVARLAHELYHASEIAREPDVIDTASLRALYERIGYRNKACFNRPQDCWETRAAVVFETLVTQQFNAW